MKLWRKAKDNVFWIIIIVGVIVLAFTLEIQEPTPKFLEVNKTNALKPIYREVKINPSFVQTELHWNQMPLRYMFKIKEDCADWQIDDMIKAFDTIENETDSIVSFIEVNERPDIEIICSSNIPVFLIDDVLAYASCERENFNNNIIKNAEITLSGAGGCNTGYPATEVHEILHTFGFIHNAKMDSIMRAYAEQKEDCTIRKIDEQYISCLKYIYSGGNYNGSCSNLDKVKSKDDLEPCSAKSQCSLGWFPSLNENSCCPESNMEILGDYCVSKCGSGFVYGLDYACYEECGEGFYCPEGSFCQNETCYKSISKEGFDK